MGRLGGDLDEVEEEGVEEREEVREGEAVGESGWMNSFLALREAVRWPRLALVVILTDFALIAIFRVGELDHEER
jgi:hypothetical protein